MQIALTKKLASAMGVKPPSAHEDENPLFSWTANWTNVWDNLKAENMLVLVNNATRFTVAIYEVKRKDLKNVAEMMRKAIANTLLSMNLNHELVEEYMSLADELEFTQNCSRQKAAWVTKAGLDCAFYVGNKYNGIAQMFDDTVGVPVNYTFVNYSRSKDKAFIPHEQMLKALSDLTGKQAYKYRAFELLITLDLGVYRAVRKIIVPANIDFFRFHSVLQSVFNWRNYHLFDFTIFDKNNRNRITRLVPFEHDRQYDKDAILMKEHNLSEFFPKHKHMIYTYDMGDNWQHEIQLVRVIEEHDQESPNLLEATGQTPPEDVGGVSGFVEFREIMLDSNHPEYSEVKEWANFWTPELSEWRKRPRVIHI